MKHKGMGNRDDKDERHRKNVPTSARGQSPINPALVDAHVRGEEIDEVSEA